MLYAEQPWTLVQKLAFRFFFLFFMLTIGITVLTFIPFMTEAITWFQNLAVPFVGKYLFGISTDLKVYAAGSGDKLSDWIWFFCSFLLALTGAAAWSWFDRRRPHYARLMEWSRIYFRYLLAFTMFTYGFAKVLHSQMPAPSLNTLMKPYGQASPMNLLWTFIGASKAYSAYTGWMEVLGGALLFFRKTLLLGALTTTVVMFNVFMLNMCYDVPVKIFSFTLTIMAVYIAAPDLHRVWDVFITHKKIEARPVQAFFNNPKWNIRAMIVKVGLIALMSGWAFYENWANRNLFTDRPPLYGIYDVKSMEKNGQTMTPLFTDSTYWRKLVVNWPGFAGIRMANDSLKAFVFKVDTVQKSVLMHPRADTTLKNTLYYSFSGDKDLEIRGLFGRDSIRVRMQRFDENQFLLVRRGFHWVSEVPYNR